MIKLNFLEKLSVKLSINQKGKKIVNKKSSPNYGNQTIADTIVNKTELSQKTRADVRKLEIEKTGERKFKVKAVYSDGSTDKGFEAHWYGWQHGRGLVWTPLGKSNTIDLGQTRFSDISVWVYDQPGKEGADKNVSISENIGDKPWQ